jgi:GNAT superfamily N-acetyltransferase
MDRAVARGPDHHPGFIIRNEVYAAVFEEEMGGFYALVERGRTIELEHLWVSPERIGTGVGRALFDHAVQRPHLWVLKS